MRAVLEWLRRLTSSIRPPRTDEDLQAELRSHLEMAADDETRRTSPSYDPVRIAKLRAGTIDGAMEAVRDQRALPWLTSIRADVVFSWRQIARFRVTSLAVILSLGLAMGAALAAFRLVDAVLTRPLPVDNPSQLYVLQTIFPGGDSAPDVRDDFDYPSYRAYVTVTAGQADLMLLGMASRRSVVIDSGEPETIVQQFVSGNALATLGLRPALGRILGVQDDAVPGGHSTIVLSHDFWQRRFGGDRAVVGRTLEMGDRPYEIVGVIDKGFTGTEPGAVTDVFVPSMMNPEALEAVGWSWFRIWVRPRPGVTRGEIEARLLAHFRADHAARAKAFASDTPPARVQAFLDERLALEPASSGASLIQKTFRQPLWILASLAALLLLIACANVANLLLTRALARRAELALRLSLGATRGRLLQLMMVESGMLAVFACAAAALFAWWAAPFIISMLSAPERPVRLVLDLDARTLLLALALIVMVTVLFGLTPALRASATTPFGALKDVRGPRGHRRLTGALVAIQVALSVFLLIGANLFDGTLDRLQTRPLGFSPSQLLHVIVDSRRKMPAAEWEQLAASLERVSGIDSAVVAGWAPLTGNRWRSTVVAPGVTPPAEAPNWVSIAPGYFAGLQLPMIDGREFRSGEASPRRDEAGKPAAGVGIVNETFARVYFNGENPVGRRVIVRSSQAPMEIVGLVKDALYFSVREAAHPAVYVPLEARDGATLLLRMDGSPADLPRQLRQELARIAPDVILRETMWFDGLVTQQMVRERLLAVLSTFFAALAVVLAAIGIYGTLNHAVTRERREIGLRLVLGARPAHLASRLVLRLLTAAIAGSLAGLAGGLAFGRYVESLLFQTHPADPAALVTSLIVLGAASLLAVLPPAIRAVRTDPSRVIVTEG